MEVINNKLNLKKKQLLFFKIKLKCKKIQYSTKFHQPEDQVYVNILHNSHKESTNNLDEIFHSERKYKLHPVEFGMLSSTPN